MSVDVDNVYVIKGLNKICACDDLARFVEWDLWQGKLIRIFVLFLTEDESSGENNGCSLGGVSIFA